MKILLISAALMVAGAGAQERCGCNKPNVNKPKVTVAPAPVAKQQPAPARQCAQQKPCAGKPARAA